MNKEYIEKNNSDSVISEDILKCIKVDDGIGRKNKSKNTIKINEESIEMIAKEIINEDLARW